MVSSVVRAVPPPSRSGQKPYFSPAPPRVIAHRGLAIGAPENTLLSFLNAAVLGVTHLETDVHASLDGIAVISHDRDLKRLVDRTVRVDELTMGELRRIQLGDGQTFCSLAEALDAFPDSYFNIDVKSKRAIGPTAKAILAANAISRVLVTSFSESRRKRAVRLLPGVATAASAPRFVAALVAAKFGIGPGTRRALRTFDAVQVPERAIGISITTERMIRRFHAAGVEVHVWTVNDPVRMRELLDRGVDGLVTDRADLALEVLAAR